MKYLVLAINLLLVIWIANQLATLTWGMLSPKEADAPVVTAPRNLPVKADRDRQLIAQLPGWHLMGIAQQNTAPAKTAIPENAPDTRLKLTLRGALASDDPVNARAIIADPKGQDEQYSIGDTLPGNAELSEIFPDRVILKRSGRYETLRLPQESRPAPGRSARTAPVSRTRRNSNPQARLAAVRQQIQSNPRSLGNLVRATPKKGDDGKIVGYTVEPGNDPEMFNAAGLQGGDVVIQVNDLPLSEPASTGKALQALQSGESITVVLMRGGQEQTLTLDGQ